MSDLHDYIFSEPFLAVRHKSESHGRSGKFLNGPVLFVIHYDPHQDEFSMLPVSWDAARTLAPKALDGLAEKLQRVRALREAEDGVETQRDYVNRRD